MRVAFYSKHIVFHKLCKTYIFCIYKTICFAQVYVFAYAKVYTLYKKYLVLHMQNNIILRMYMVLQAATLIHKHAKTDFKYIVTISCALMMTIIMIMLTTKVFLLFSVIIIWLSWLSFYTHDAWNAFSCFIFFYLFIYFFWVWVVLFCFFFFTRVLWD